MIVNNQGVILKSEWVFNGMSYKIISSETIGYSVWSTIDTVKREDKLIRSFTRNELNKYFND